MTTTLTPLFRLAAGAVALIVACARPQPAESPVHARARGNEPFWAVTASPTSLVYKTPDLLPDSLIFTVGSPARAGDTLTWTATAAGRTLTLRLVLGACQDTMSGEEFEWTAAMSIDSTSAQGCAEVAAEPITARQASPP